MKQSLIDFFVSHTKEIQEIGIATLTVMTATFIKLWKALQDGLKPTFKWFLGETFMSAVVGATAYYIFDRLLHFDKLLVCIICVWIGSASTIFSKRVEDLVGSLFDWLKSAIANKSLLIIGFSVLFITLASCGKKIVHADHKIESKTDHDKSTVITKETSQAILDSLFVKINKIKTARPECDSITNAELDKLLAKIESFKKSGNNELGFYYDALNRVLVAHGKIAESVSKNTDTKETINTDMKENQIKEVPIKFVPLWVKYLAIFGCLSVLGLIFWIYKKLVLWQLAKQ